MEAGNQNRGVMTWSTKTRPNSREMRKKGAVTQMKTTYDMLFCLLAASCFHVVGVTKERGAGRGLEVEERSTQVFEM